MRQLTPDELSARKKRNLAIAGALVAFMVIVFGVMEPDGVIFTQFTLKKEQP